jgi:hypothetical protein
MDIEYVIDEDGVGIVNFSKYELDDSEKSLKKWRKLLNDFREEFNVSLEEHKDYELTEWHNELMCLFVYLYKDKFYNKKFIPKIINILKHNGDSLAQFECYNDNQELIGSFQVYQDKVYFNEMFQESGIIDQLCVVRDKTKLTF